MLDACIRVGIQGVSVSGTRPLIELRLGTGKGSLAGRAAFDDAVRITREVVTHVHGALAVRAAGGVFGGADALALLQAGVSTVELYPLHLPRLGGRWPDQSRTRAVARSHGVRDLRRAAAEPRLQVAGATPPNA